MARKTTITGEGIRDETVDSEDLASGSIKAGELNPQVISGQTLITSTDTANDRVLVWDATDSALKQVSPTNLGLGTATPVGSDAQIQYNNGGSFGGAAAFYWDDANNRVGIGTAAPDNTLHVESPGTTHIKIQSEEGNFAALKFVAGTGGSTYVWTPADTSDLRFYTNGNDRMHIDSDGSVGIGTTNPQYPLAVVGFVSSSTGFIGRLTDADNDTYITTESTADEDKIRIFTGGNQRMMLRNSDEAVAISDNNVGDFTPLALLHVSGAGSGGDQLFIVGGGSANKPNALVVDQNGQVGIGDFTGNAANPLASLSVSGTLGVYKTDSTTNSKAEAQFILDCTRGSGHDSTWKVGSHYHSDSLHKFRIAEGNTNVFQIIEGAGASSLYIDENSNVGIGTSAPACPLDVHMPAGYFSALPNDVGGGLVVKFGTGTLTAGKLYYLHTDGAWTESDASATATGADQLLGIALGPAPGTDGILLRGFFDADAYLSNFSAGKAVYISETAANMDTTAPSSVPSFVRIVGYCTNNSKVIYFNPSSTWVEL